MFVDISVSFSNQRASDGQKLRLHDEVMLGQVGARKAPPMREDSHGGATIAETALPTLSSGSP
jgi:hypothetical protein